MATATDGYRLWYDAAGDPTARAIILPARFRLEFAALGGALAERYHVVRYQPRQAVGVLEPEDEAGGPFDPSAFDAYPIDLEVDDLHLVADAAGMGDFVLGGYSGMAALAAFLAPHSPRAQGLIVGGFPLLAPMAYWLGFEEGAHAALLQAGLAELAARHHLGRQLYREWEARDDGPLFAALPGPKIIWFGERDGEPDCRMYDYVGGAAIARQLRAHAADLEDAGFDLIEFEDLDHIAAISTTEVVAPALLAALDKAGW